MATNKGNRSEEGLAVATASPVPFSRVCLLAPSDVLPAVKQAQGELPQEVTAGPWALLD